MQAVGLEAKEVFAESKGGGKESFLKKTVIAYKVDKNYAKVKVWFDWTTMPTNRNLDSIAVKFSYGQYERNAPGDYGTIIARHEYYQLIKNGPIGCKGTKEKIRSNMNSAPSVSLRHEEYHADNNSIRAAVKLATNESKLLSNGDVYSREISGESVYFEFYLKFTSYNKNYLEITPIYLHVKKQANILGLVKVTIDIASGNLLNVAYYLANNQIVETSYSYSGLDHIFELIVNFK